MTRRFYLCTVIYLITVTSVYPGPCRLNDKKIYRFCSFADPGFRVKKSFAKSFDYSVSLSNSIFLNWHHDYETTQILILQSFKFSCSSEYDSIFRFSLSISHNLGVQSYFDSLTRIQTDDNTLNSRIELILLKNLSLGLNSLVTTQLLNGYFYSGDSGRITRTLTSAFCSPVVITLAGGTSISLNRFGSVFFGLTSARITCIRDKKIYDTQQTDFCYGVQKGKGYLIEYGVSLQLLADKELRKWMRWNCDLLIFKNLKESVDITFKSNFGFRISKFLKAGFQTRVLYEKCSNAGLQLENIFTLGFSLHL